ncbi:MAG: hypothetical protein KC475_05380 [Cyanobacteria bacterium HKST-UBA03]|nr:hypothetical protein [Cyanobacteria bacterium HKST-UBA03]
MITIPTFLPQYQPSFGRFTFRVKPTGALIGVDLIDDQKPDVAVAMDFSKNTFGTAVLEAFGLTADTLPQRLQTADLFQPKVIGHSPLLAKPFRAPGGLLDLPADQRSTHLFDDIQARRIARLIFSPDTFQMLAHANGSAKALALFNTKKPSWLNAFERMTAAPKDFGHETGYRYFDLGPDADQLAVEQTIAARVAHGVSAWQSQHARTTTA